MHAKSLVWSLQNSDSLLPLLIQFGVGLEVRLMRRGWAAALALFVLSSGALVAAWILSDRATVIAQLEERTLSLARMISAHGDAAIEEADKIILALQGRVAEWDFKDPVAGQQLFVEMRNLIPGSSHISSVWVVDGDGVNRLDSWSFPPRPAPSSDRPYFKRHAGGEPGLLISGDERPGSVTGKRRFTVSRAFRRPDGSLRHIIVVGIYTEGFNTLYSEVATWPDARAGLFSILGEPLARFNEPSQPSAEFFGKLSSMGARNPYGSAILSEEGAPRLISWSRSRSHPDIFGASSQTISAALAQWRWRSLLLAVLYLVAMGAIGLLAWMSVRAGEARQAAKVNELAVREVHHRVKNALQLIVSMLGLRTPKIADPLARAELEEVSARVRAIGEVQDLLQSSATLNQIDAAVLLRRLCDQLQKGYSGEISFSGREGHVIDSAKATTLAVIANELITNALKYGKGSVAVTATPMQSRFVMSVSDDGPGLPDGFDMENTDRFGMRVARMMAESVGGRLSVPRSQGPGATIQVDMPA
jgi:two-component sensor histidine kinase